jgi:YHS domain-containing protein
MCGCAKPNKDMKEPVDSTAAMPTKKLATDPVCGMNVDPANAASLEYKGASFHFCNKGCAAKDTALSARFWMRSTIKRLGMGIWRAWEYWSQAFLASGSLFWHC